MQQVTLQEAFEQALNHHQGGRLELARRIYLQILSQAPDHLPTNYQLGILLLQTGRPGEAIESLDRALAINPDYFNARVYRVVALQAAGRTAEALELNNRLVALSPQSAFLHNNQGNIMLSLGRADDAVESYEKAIALDPKLSQAYNNLGAICGFTGKIKSAIECCRKAVGINPHSVDALNNLGTALKYDHEYDEALSCYCKVVELAPDHYDAYNNLGNLYRDMGLFDQAVGSFEKSLSLRPIPENHSNFILLMQYHAGFSLRQIRDELRKWNDAYAAGLNRRAAPMGDEKPAVLRVGFVSRDLRSHPVGRFMLPLLANMDRSRFFVACYSDALAHDSLSEQLQAHCDLWINSAALNPDQLDRRIRDDGIHILIDLAAHTAGNRLLLFARKPAPLQITWLAYCGSTGLSAMDYRISDPFMDPVGMFDEFHCEKTVRLPSTYWCYPAPSCPAAIAPLPRLKNGFITFGCLNNFCKITPPVIECWIEILKRVEGSRLVIHAGEGSCRVRFAGAFEKAGIDPSRVGFVSYLSRDEYYDAYGNIDIALDPFPFNGGTTSCDGLWMGVVFITMEADRPVGRMGASILSNIGLTEFIAKNPGQYVDLAAQLAADTRKLEHLRKNLREMMLAAPLMDAPRFAGDFSALLQRAWEEKGGRQPWLK